METELRSHVLGWCVNFFILSSTFLAGGVWCWWSPPVYCLDHHVNRFQSYIYGWNPNLHVSISNPAVSHLYKSACLWFKSYLSGSNPKFLWLKSSSFIAQIPFFCGSNHPFMIFYSSNLPMVHCPPTLYGLPSIRGARRRSMAGGNQDFKARGRSSLRRSSLLLAAWSGVKETIWTWGFYVICMT